MAQYACKNQDEHKQDVRKNQDEHKKQDEHKNQDGRKIEKIVIHMYPPIVFPDAFSLGTLLPDEEFYNLLYPPSLVRPERNTRSVFLRSRL